MDSVAAAYFALVASLNIAILSATPVIISSPRESTEATSFSTLNTSMPHSVYFVKLERQPAAEVDTNNSTASLLELTENITPHEMEEKLNVSTTLTSLSTSAYNKTDPSEVNLLKNANTEHSSDEKLLQETKDAVTIKSEETTGRVEPISTEVQNAETSYDEDSTQTYMEDTSMEDETPKPTPEKTYFKYTLRFNEESTSETTAEITATDFMTTTDTTTPILSTESEPEPTTTLISASETLPEELKEITNETIAKSKQVDLNPFSHPEGKSQTSATKLSKLEFGSMSSIPPSETTFSSATTSLQRKTDTYTSTGKSGGKIFKATETTKSYTLKDAHSSITTKATSTLTNTTPGSEHNDHSHATSTSSIVAHSTDQTTVTVTTSSQDSGGDAPIWPNNALTTFINSVKNFSETGTNSTGFDYSKYNTKPGSLTSTITPSVTKSPNRPSNDEIRKRQKRVSVAMITGLVLSALFVVVCAAASIYAIKWYRLQRSLDDSMALMSGRRGHRQPYCYYDTTM